MTKSEEVDPKSIRGDIKHSVRLTQNWIRYAKIRVETFS